MAARAAVTALAVIVAEVLVAAATVAASVAAATVVVAAAVPAAVAAATVAVAAEAVPAAVGFNSYMADHYVVIYLHMIGCEPVYGEPLCCNLLTHDWLLTSIWRTIML